MKEIQFKKYVRMKIEKAAFNYLEKLKLSHSKVKRIAYNKLEAQQYIKSDQFNDEEVRELFSLRSRMTPVKANFS